MVLEPACRALCCRGAGCLCDVGTYLPSTVLQECRLFKQCLNLPAVIVLQRCRLFLRCQNLLAGHCLAGSRQFKQRSAGCLSGVGTYLQGTVLQGCRLFMRCLNLSA